MVNKNNEIVETDENMIIDFIKEEEKQIIHFLSNFEIIGLTIASIIGLSVASVSKSFSSEIIMPVIEQLFSESWKTYVINIGSIKLGIGLFLSEIINLCIVVIIMFVAYSFFKTYLGNILDKKVKWHKTLAVSQNNILNELKNITTELKEHNKKKKSNEI
tara:strand:+ start:613 stop:1092 length:480 start_codon:yes stop_codon:yes gene_type:complete